MSVNIVYICRGGAPDKINLKSMNDNFIYIPVDGCNVIELLKHRELIYFRSKFKFDFKLPDKRRKLYTVDELKELVEVKEYILSADEFDIEWCNKYLNELKTKNEEFKDIEVILPLDKNNSIINYYEYIPKNSHIYDLNNQLIKKGIKYSPYISYTLSQFNRIFLGPLGYINRNRLVNKVIKLTISSGSRGVLVSDVDMFNKGILNYYNKIPKTKLKELIDYGYNLYKYYDLIEEPKIIVQDLSELYKRYNLKVNCDFIIKNEKLIDYKFELVEKNSNFTNWYSSTVIVNDINLHKIMVNISNYLVSKGIKNALMNFEGFINNSKNITKLDIVEFNWRYSNSMFETQALGYDMIEKYITSTSESSVNDLIEDPIKHYNIDIKRIEDYYECSGKELSKEIIYNYIEDILNNPEYIEIRRSWTPIIKSN